MKKMYKIYKNVEITIDDVVNSLSEIGLQELIIAASLKLRGKSRQVEDIASSCCEAEEKIAHTQAQKLASKYGKNAMQGTPVVIDSKTVVIKRSKKGDAK